MSVNVADARGLSFACRPGCGFCCTATPLVQPQEEPALRPLVVRAEDGTLRIPLSGPACSSLLPDMRCGVYDRRPAVCRLYPYQVHAGRRLQAVVTLACPGIAEGAQEGGESAEEGAQRAAALALAQPGAAEMAARARETFAEFDRRMKEWGVDATPDRLRAAFLPHVAALATPARLPAFFAGLAPGDLVLDGKPARAVEALLDAEPQALLEDLLAHAAAEGLDEPETVVWVEPDLTWTSARATAEGVRLLRRRDGAWAPTDVPLDELPTAWTEDASAVLARYLERLCHRDHAEGAAAWLVDASGYQATPAAAYGRVLGEAALQVVLRAGALAAEAGADEVDATLARRGVAAYETAFHSLPTLGAIL